MIDSLLMIPLGVIAVLASFGKLQLNRDPAKNQEYLSKYGMLLRILGIILIVCGVVLTLMR